MQDNFTFRRPTAEELQRAHGKTVPDLIRPDLKVLFCGINPGLYSGATGLHFARPGNRFWPALFAAGFTDRLLHPSEREELLSSGYGITAIVRRATATAAELDDDEYRSGRINSNRDGWQSLDLARSAPDSTSRARKQDDRKNELRNRGYGSSRIQAD
jgi:mismatch-specific thymine-DNA glycosylase